MASLKNQIKTDQEIIKIKNACEVGDLAFEYILGKLMEGITEIEAAKLIRDFFKRNNAGISFRPIVAFGKSASEVHHKPTNLKLKKNHGFIMIDLGAKLEGYCSDMTRTVFFGKTSTKQKKIYQTVVTAQQKSMNLIQSSIKNNRTINGRQADEAARIYIIEQGFPNIPHTLGHGIGRKVHEGFRLGPKSKTILRTGMVFTIEPGIYLRGFGGVRIEDTFLLGDNKLESLTKSNRSLIEL